VKTPRSKSIALLCSVTYLDHFLFMRSVFPGCSNGNHRLATKGEPYA
jgi:hypothetical protein